MFVDMPVKGLLLATALYFAGTVLQAAEDAWNRSVTFLDRHLQ